MNARAQTRRRVLPAVGCWTLTKLPLSVPVVPNGMPRKYFGNEASHIDFYVRAALLVQVPEFSETCGDVVAAPEEKKKASKKRKTQA